MAFNFIPQKLQQKLILCLKVKVVFLKASPSSMKPTLLQKSGFPQLSLSLSSPLLTLDLHRFFLSLPYPLPGKGQERRKVREHGGGEGGKS